MSMNSCCRRILLIGVGSALLLATGFSFAQAFPAKPIRLVVPQAAGSGPDVLARALGEVLSKSLGQPVLVENRPGANGTLAAAYVLSQPADGHTLFLAGVSNMAWNPYLYKSLSHQPSRDFAGVAVIANTPFLTAVSPSLGVKSLAELVQRAKAEPGKISFASAGIGNSTHLAGELLMDRLGIQMQHVPFSGAGGQSAATSLMAGETPVMTSVPAGLVPLALASKVVPLAVTGDRRLAQLPNVSTFRELGINMEVPGWYSIVVRAGTSADAIRRLNADINKALETPTMLERLAQQMLTPMKGEPQEVERLTRRDSEAWAPIINRLGIAQ